MNTVFVGGSRHVSRLPFPVQERLKNIIKAGHEVVVGDAAGADKAVQKFLADASYAKVTVFCSGEKYRNNLGHWHTHNVEAPKNAKGFQFYALKDRKMAERADFGLMIWDGKSPGTVLNVLRLVRAGKMSVLFEAPEQAFVTFRTPADWHAFINRMGRDFVAELRDRATPEEWASSPTEQVDLPPALQPAAVENSSLKTDEQLVSEINAALGTGDTASAVVALGEIARMHGMSQVAKDAGLARESLYRSFNQQGNPEFTTVLKVIQALGLRLRVDGVVGSQGGLFPSAR